MTLIELAIGLHCFMVPWAMQNGLNGQYTCHPVPGGTAIMEVVKISDHRARVLLKGAEFETQICPGWCNRPKKENEGDANVKF